MMLKQSIHCVYLSFLAAACLISSPVQSNYPIDNEDDFYPNRMRNYSPPEYTSQSTYRQDPMARNNGDPTRGRAWNWDYKESWRDNRDIFFSGGTQTTAMQQEFRYQRPPGIGDPDDAYWLDPRFYRQQGYDQRRSNYPNYYQTPRPRP